MAAVAAAVAGLEAPLPAVVVVLEEPPVLLMVVPEPPVVVEPEPPPVVGGEASPTAPKVAYCTVPGTGDEQLVVIRRIAGDSVVGPDGLASLRPCGSVGSRGVA